MSAHSQHDLRPGGIGSAVPREMSTRAGLANILNRLEKVNAHLSNAMHEHWDQSDPPSEAKNLAGATTSRPPTHFDLLDSINGLLSSIENRVEFISARL